MHSHHRSFYFLIQAIISVFIFGIATGCGTGASEEPAPVSLKIGILPYISNSVIMIADEEGYFTEQGLAVELVTIKSSNDIIPLLLKGDLDAATPPLTPGFFNAVAKGSNLKMVLPLTDFEKQDCPSMAYLARKADAQGYQDMNRWKNAKIIVSSSGTQNVAGYTLFRVLQQGGLTLDDVQIETVSKTAQAEALRTGQADIVYAVEPWITRMLADGQDEFDILFPAEPIVPGLTSSAIIFGDRLLANPDIGKRFATAYLKAVRQYLKGKTTRNVEIIADFTQLEPDLVKQICWSHSPADGEIDVDSIMGYQTWLKSEGALDKIVGAEVFLDTQFAEAANQALEKSKK